MKGTITGYTTEGNELVKEGVETFSGKNAGVCYMEQSYFNSNVTDKEKAIKRFRSTIANGHHSIADHYKVTMVLEGIPKIVAMILNSLGDYCTSEKSGRYTIMSGCSDEEVKLYNKWILKLEAVVEKEYPFIDEKQRLKLAQENARYMLSVFTPTTMSYTTSIRQWNYIRQWCLKFECKTKFDKLLKEKLLELANTIETTGLVIEGLEDFKNRDFEFMSIQSNNLYAEEPLEQFGSSYTLNYKASFVHLAQAQRHRTLDYFMRFNGEATEFFVPYVLDGQLAEEWLDDIKSVAHLYPNGTLVNVTETGNIMNFILKCKERLCGRAQIEIMKQTDENLKKLYMHTTDNRVKDMLSEYLIFEESNIIKSKTKCMMLSGCKEGCVHTVSNALTRKI